MAILEMIPREYWRLLYTELKSVWGKLESDRIDQEKKEHERRSAEYAEAIKRKRKENKNKRQNKPEAKAKRKASQNTPEAKAKRREYMKKYYWAKKKQNKAI